jgi:hypothetical protein
MSYLFFPSPTPLFPVLPPLTWSVHKKPVLASTVATAMSGRDAMLARAAYPRWSYILSYGGSNSWLRDQTQNIVMDPTLPGYEELEKISGLFLQCLGSYGEFFYDDPDDDSRSAQFITVSTGIATSVSYSVFYSWGTGPFTPPLTLPVGGLNTIDQVYVDGVPINQTLYPFTIDSTQTMITFTSGLPAGTITADFHFYQRCRFLDDKQEYDEFLRNLWKYKECRFETVKP